MESFCMGVDPNVAFVCCTIAFLGFVYFLKIVNMDYVNKLALANIKNNILTSLLSGSLFFGRLRFLINIFAILVSWFYNKSILWAIFHYIFGFWYLIYSLLLQRFSDGKFMEIINYYF